jgi:hypothetical protein
LLAKHGITGSYPQRTTPAGTLFVTEDLHVCGPQRSLVNLLCGLPANQKTFLCVLGGIPATSYRDALEQAQVPILTQGVNGTLDKVEGILGWADKLNVRNICFWNAHPEVKLALAKILSVRNIRLIDVSPGPMLFDELDSASFFQHRICMNAERYFRRLDCFVAKYSRRSRRSRCAAITERLPSFPTGSRCRRGSFRSHQRARCARGTSTRTLPLGHAAE